MKYRFNVSLARIRSDLERTSKKLGYEQVRLLQGKDGSGMVELLDSQRQRKLVCRRFANPHDNLRAIGLTLEYQRRISEDYGAEIVKEAAAMVAENRGLIGVGVHGP